MSARTEDEQLLMDNGWQRLMEKHNGQRMWLKWDVTYDPIPIVKTQAQALLIVREKLSPPPHLNKEDSKTSTNDASGGGGEQK